MTVLYLSPTPPLALPPGVGFLPSGGWKDRFRLWRAKPSAVIFGHPDLQRFGRFVSYGWCAFPEHGSIYHSGTWLLAGTMAARLAMQRAGRQAHYLPWPVPDLLAPPPAGQCLLVVAPLVRASCLDLLIKALAAIPRLSLVYAGRGPARGKLADLAASLSIPLRFTPHARASDYHQASIVVLPARQDWEGGAVRAAWSAGRPVIATMTEAARELIMPNETGLLVPPADGPAIGHAVRLLLENPAMAAGLAAAGRQAWQAQGLFVDAWRGNFAALSHAEEKI